MAAALTSERGLKVVNDMSDHTPDIGIFPIGYIDLRITLVFRNQNGFAFFSNQALDGQFAFNNSNDHLARDSVF